MNDKLDELLNDYIDNSLNNDLVNELNKKLKEDEEAVKKLKALRIVDEALKNMEVYRAPENFTEQLMKIIVDKSQAIKRSMKSFVVSIISIFSIIFLTICIALFLLAEKEEPKINVSSVINNFIDKGTNIINSYINNNLFLVISSSIVLISISLIYMLIDSHYSFRNKLNDITQ